MDITEVKIELVNSSRSKIRAFCSIILDNLLKIHNIKIIEGADGLFLAMPGRELTRECINCTGENPIRANFCNKCGTKLPPGEPLVDINGHLKRGKYLVWIVDSELDKLIQQEVIKAYNRALKNTPVNPVKFSWGNSRDGNSRRNSRAE